MIADAQAKREAWQGCLNCGEHRTLTAQELESGIVVCDCGRTYEWNPDVNGWLGYLSPKNAGIKVN